MTPQLVKVDQVHLKGRPNRKKRLFWRILILFMATVYVLLGPILFSIQFVTKSFAPYGSCGNGHPPLPNTDLISWWLIGNTSSFEQACFNHDACYATLGKSKWQCDQELLTDLKAGCQQTFRQAQVDQSSSHLFQMIGYLGCIHEARTIWGGVILIPEVHQAYCVEQLTTLELNKPEYAQLSRWDMYDLILAQDSGFCRRLRDR